MAVRIRMKRIGRRHRPFFRICAIDARSPRDGRVIEELGHYDPMGKETDARAVLKADRIEYWLSVGAQPSDKVQVLIKKYGKEGTHLEQQKAARERLKSLKPQAPPPQAVPSPKKEKEEESQPAATDADTPEQTESTETPEAEAPKADGAAADE